VLIFSVCFNLTRRPRASPVLANGGGGSTLETVCKVNWFGPQKGKEIGATHVDRYATDTMLIRDHTLSEYRRHGSRLLITEMQYKFDDLFSRRRHVAKRSGGPPCHTNKTTQLPTQACKTTAVKVWQRLSGNCLMLCEQKHLSCLARNLKTLRVINHLEQTTKINKI